MIIIFIVAQIIATFILAFTIYTVVVSSKIKVNFELIATLLIGTMFLIAAIYLSATSLGYYIAYALITSFFVMVIETSAHMKLGGTITSAIISFLCWPQVVCLAIFMLQHMNKLNNEND